MDNTNLERDQKIFLRRQKEGHNMQAKGWRLKNLVGQMLEMEKVGKFWGDIWEKDDTTTEMPWMESVSEQLRDKITNVKEFSTTEDTFEKETKKRKSWTAPGIDGIQNFWWKRLKPTRRELERAFEQAKDNNDLKQRLTELCCSKTRKI